MASMEIIRYKSHFWLKMMRIQTRLPVEMKMGLSMRMKVAQMTRMKIPKMKLMELTVLKAYMHSLKNLHQAK
jgi:hypothetical protein